MDRSSFGQWLTAYESAWRTAGTEPLCALFAEDATYQAAPFEPPLRGRQAIAEFWEAEREGPDEVFTLTTQIIAVEENTGVARVEVVYGEPEVRRYRDVWIVTVDGDLRCTAFEEWPFFPGQLRSAVASRLPNPGSAAETA